METSQAGPQVSTFYSALQSFNFSQEWSINLCFLYSVALLVQDQTLPHSFQKQLQGPESHLVKFIPCPLASISILVSLLLLMMKYPDKTNLDEKWFVYLTHNFRLKSIIAGMIEQQELERARHSTTVKAEQCINMCRLMLHSFHFVESMIAFSGNSPIYN